MSSGLLGVATPAELEAIVAHEIGHLKARDVLTQTIVTVLAAAAIDASRIGGYFQRAFLFVLGPLAASFVHLVLSPQREYEADRFAANLCGSPHGMADGLLRLEQSMGIVEFQASPATEPLYTVNPFADEGLARCSTRTRRSVSACSGSGSSTRSGARSCARRSSRLNDGEPGSTRLAKKMGGVLLSRGIAPRVPSALAGLTSLFGMGRGISPPL